MKDFFFLGVAKDDSGEIVEAVWQTAMTRANFERLVESGTGPRQFKV